MSSFLYSFPSIRGVQAGREYFVSMCPLKLIPRIFLFDEDELGPELRAQRTLNRARIPEMARYVIENRTDYVFSALTASVSGEVQFEPLADDDARSRLGLLKIDMNAQFIINDGQHRRAAIEQAIKEDPSLGDETMAVVFFVDQGLERSQQMFADLNRYAVRPSRSLGLLYDHRSDSAKVGKLVAIKCECLKGLVEFERTSLSERSRKLFTLSALTAATNDFLVGSQHESINDAVALAISFWSALFERIPEWKLVRNSKMTAGEIRRDFVHSHGVMLQAFGRLGSAIRQTCSDAPDFAVLDHVSTIDWSRSNARDWEGRVMIVGRMSKTSNSVSLATAFLNRKLGLELSPEEIRVEGALKGTAQRVKVR